MKGRITQAPAGIHRAPEQVEKTWIQKLDEMLSKPMGDADADDFRNKAAHAHTMTHHAVEMHSPEAHKAAAEAHQKLADAHAAMSEECAPDSERDGY